MIQLYVDGSALGNPGPAGWSAVLVSDKKALVLVGSEKHATNQYMELYAALRGLTALKGSVQVEIVTDSKYLEGMLGTWKASANVELVADLRSAAAQHTVSVRWVKGHNGCAGNELADRLAQSAAETQTPDLQYRIAFPNGTGEWARV